MYTAPCATTHAGTPLLTAVSIIKGQIHQKRGNDSRFSTSIGVQG